MDNLFIIISVGVLAVAYSYILSKQIRNLFHFKFQLEKYNDNTFSNETQFFGLENTKIIKFKVSVYMENNIYDDILHERQLINKKYLQILGNYNLKIFLIIR